jgi:ORF6N domain
MPKNPKPIPFAVIESRIHLIRANKVMLDADLAQLYGVATKNLNKAVERNRSRFPEDFMYQLTRQEFAILRFHFGTSSLHGGRRYLPRAFTQEGIAMLSSVPRSPPPLASRRHGRPHRIDNGKTL